MQLVVEKKTGTYAETLQAIGLATLLEEIGFGRVLVGDKGAEYIVSAALELPPEHWRRPSPAYPYIWEASKEKQKPNVGRLIDYEGEKVKREVWDQYQKALKKRQSLKGAPEDQSFNEPPAPSPDLKMATILASMRKGWNADRDLAKWISGNPDKAIAWVRAELLGHSYAEAPEMTNSQVLNPIAGKGVSAPKTALRSAGSVPSQLVDSFAEWMKLRGLWTAGLLFRVGDDFKFYVLDPGGISPGGLSGVREDLERLGLWATVGMRLDIETTLRCTESLIRHSDVMETAAQERIRLRTLTPRAVIGGVRQAYFKSLGTAPALMNDAFLPVPDWFPIESVDDANAYFFIIEQTVGSVVQQPRTWGSLGSLDEKKSDDGRILQQYRRWLLTGELRELLAFHNQFAIHLMQRLGATEWAQPFSTSVLDKILSRAFHNEESMLKEIIENEGFQSVARAIRNSTIYALRLKNREVWFGLAQNWKQKMKGGSGEFATALSEFVQAQNWEVTNKLKGRGHTVTTEDLQSVLSLIETHGAELVGSLLLAYGYAKAPKIEVDDEGAGGDVNLAGIQKGAD